MSAAQGGLVFDQDFPFQTACIGSRLQTNVLYYVDQQRRPILDEQGRPRTVLRLNPHDNAHKGIAIKLGHDAHVCFDTDLLRMSAGWIGRFLNWTGVTFDGRHGDWPTLGGEQVFGTPSLPGWADAGGSFKDPRPEPFGPIPETHGRWDGLFVHGDQVVLAYRIGGTKVFELPESVARDGLTGFVRNFQISPVARALTMIVCEVKGASGRMSGATATLDHGNGNVTMVGLTEAPRGASLAIADGNRIVLKLARGTPEATFKLVLWSGPASDRAKFGALLDGPARMLGFPRPGKPRWPQTVETRGALAFNRSPDGAYEVDRLTLPQENPWGRQIRPGGFDFFADGKRAAFCTWDGDVWVVSGIDDKLEKLTWRRFASGLFETLGLKIVDEVIHVSGRDQITRLRDLDADGEADYYENFNNRITSSPGFHEFVFDLQTDREGNFYFAKAAPVRGGGRGFGGDNFGAVSASAGTLMKVSPDGKQFEVVATGFRAPNGIGVGPNGELTTGDNEGTHMPACPINWVRPGGFYGVPETAHRNPVPPRDPPLCWLSVGDFDNSGGSQVWVTSERWGPFAGQLLHLSYGKCTVNLVMRQEAGGRMQGGVVRLPVKFTSSAMRGRFNPADGQLYVMGLLGWQTSAVNPGGFDRVRYTGRPVYSVSGLQVDRAGVHLTFTQPLDPKEAVDPENYAVQRWNYQTRYDTDQLVNGRIVRGPAMLPNYGGHEVSVDDPWKPGREPMTVTGATVSPDGRTATLQLADLKPAMQMLIRFSLRAADGTPIEQEVLHTVHGVP